MEKSSSEKWYPTDAEGSWYLPWLNISFFFLNFLITYGSIGGWFGPSNTELSKKYMTIVTPSGWAFSIWGLIFTGEALFAVMQTDLYKYCCASQPSLKESKTLHRGIYWFWIAACVAQCCWTVAFAQEVIWLSFVFMISIWLSLAAILYRTYYIEKSYLEYWFLVAPFQIHIGWITAASFVNLNVVAYDGWGCTLGQYATSCTADDVNGMHTYAFISVAFLVMIAFYLSSLNNPNIFTTGVIAWALTGLQDQHAKLEAEFPDFFNVFKGTQIIPGVRNAVIFFMWACWCLVILNLLKLVFQEFLWPFITPKLDEESETQRP